MNAVTGDVELDRKLLGLAGKGAQVAIEAGMRAALTPLNRALRTAINASSASPALKAAARKAIGRRAGKAKRGAAKGDFQAKAGFGVGKRKAPPPRGKRRGKGISAQNIHWPVLGTAPRATRAGRSTGSVPAILADVTDQAFAASAEAMHAAAKAKIADSIAKQAAKRG